RGLPGRQRRAGREEAGQVPHRVRQRQAGDRDRHHRLGVRQGPAAQRGVRADREEHRLRVGEPQAGLPAADPRVGQEGAVLMAAARAQQAQGTGLRGRILRVGILLGGKIVEERLIRDRTPVTIGQSMRNTFSVPVEGLPLEFTLFALDDGRYSLRFLPKMDGRLSDSGGQVHTLEALRARAAANHGSYHQIAVTESARGKLSLGDLTILFQFVTGPPRQPKPMLPASVRGTLADRIDPHLAVILGASIVLHFAIAIWALLADVPTDSGIAERAYNLVFKQDTYPIDVSQPKPAEPGPGSAEKKPDKPPERVKAPPAPGGNDAGRNREQQIALQEQEAARYADLLTGEGPNGTSDGDMSRRRP